MSYLASHTIVYLIPATRPTFYDQEFRFSPTESNGPTSLTYVPPLEVFASLVWYADNNLYFRCKYHYHFLEDPPTYSLIWSATVDKSTGLVNISSYYSTPIQSITLAISIPFEYRGYTSFSTSKKVDFASREDVVTWYPLPQTVVWDNQGSGTEDKNFYIHVALGNTAFPIWIPPPPPGLRIFPFIPGGIEQFSR